jgi:uncharacterized protein YecT (DUF1311 family)
MRSTFLASALLLSLPTTANAKATCVYDGTQTEMTLCAKAHFEDADAELNRIWPNAILKAKKSDGPNCDDSNDQCGFEKALLKSQRAWIEFRDRQCAFEGFDARGGSLEPMLISVCRERMTLDRIKQLLQPNSVSGE